MSKDDQYYELAESWATDSFGKDNKSRRLAWAIAACAIGIAIIEAVALVVLLPLKTVETVPILVDKTSGFVQPLNIDGMEEIKTDEALIQSLLAQYVSAREGFDYATAKTNYRKTALWSGESARNNYVTKMEVNNPESPFKKYNEGDVIEVDVKSVSQVSPGNALVRFDTRFVGIDGRSNVAGSWLSVIKYQFSDAQMSFKDRLVNPLGLQILSYRRDVERPKEAALEIINESSHQTVIAKEGVNSPVSIESDFISDEDDGERE